MAKREIAQRNKQAEVDKAKNVEESRSKQAGLSTSAYRELKAGLELTALMDSGKDVFFLPNTIHTARYDGVLFTDPMMFIDMRAAAAKWYMPLGIPSAWLPDIPVDRIDGDKRIWYYIITSKRDDKESTLAIKLMHEPMEDIVKRFSLVIDTSKLKKPEDAVVEPTDS